MRILYLIRHAKSSWDDPGLKDFERPLNKRGKKDAPFMAKLLRKMNIVPDLIISSPANRAITTAKIFGEELEYSINDIVTEPMLYEADGKDFLDVVRRIDDTNKIIFLFSHNPGLTDFSNYISGEDIDNIPTCGIAALRLEKNSWREIDENSSKLIYFEYPKKYL